MRCRNGLALFIHDFAHMPSKVPRRSARLLFLSCALPPLHFVQMACELIAGSSLQLCARRACCTHMHHQHAILDTPSSMKIQITICLSHVAAAVAIMLEPVSPPLGACPLQAAACSGARVMLPIVLKRYGIERAATGSAAAVVPVRNQLPGQPLPLSHVLFACCMPSQPVTHCVEVLHMSAQASYHTMITHRMLESN